MSRSLEIIFTPEAQAQAGCKGPTFKNPSEVNIMIHGVSVETVTLPSDTDSGGDPVTYFYPMGCIARVKEVF